VFINDVMFTSCCPQCGLVTFSSLFMIKVTLNQILVTDVQGRHLGGLGGSMDPPKVVKCKNFALPASLNDSL